MTVSQKWTGLRFPDSRLVGLIARYVPRKQGSAVDVGCGSGNNTKMLTDFGFDAYGVECNPQMLEIARSNGISVIDSAIEKFIPEQVPYLLVAWGITPLADIKDVAGQLAKVGAEYIVCDWRTEKNTIFKYPDNVWLGEQELIFKNSRSHLYDLHYRFHSQEECRIPGYELVKIQTLTVTEGDELNEWYQTVFKKL